MTLALVNCITCKSLAVQTRSQVILCTTPSKFQTYLEVEESKFRSTTPSLRWRIRLHCGPVD